VLCDGLDVTRIVFAFSSFPGSTSAELSHNTYYKNINSCYLLFMVVIIEPSMETGERIKRGFLHNAEEISTLFNV